MSDMNFNIPQDETEDITVTFAIEPEVSWGRIGGTLSNQTDLQDALDDIEDSIPTKTSDLTNDSGFITSSYHDATKQDKLTAGTNITIDANNVISASGTVAIDWANVSSQPKINNHSLASGNNTLETLGIASASELDSLDARVESAEDDITTLQSNKVNVSDIVNNLTSTDTNKPLSANQGKVLNDSKQANLVSGTNIKTINSTSLLGSGNISVQPTLVSGTNIKTLNNTSLLGSGNISISNSWGNITGTLSNQTDLQDALDDKQDTLVSGTNIKTINNNSIIGSGNLDLLPKLDPTNLLFSYNYSNWINDYTYTCTEDCYVTNLIDADTYLIKLIVNDVVIWQRATSGATADVPYNTIFKAGDVIKIYAFKLGIRVWGVRY